MKMRKYLLGMITMIAILLLAACGSDPRKEFTKELFRSQNEANNAASFKLKINDLAYDGAEDDPYVNMIVSQLKGLNIDGHYALDDKTDTMEMTITANLLGKKLPFQFVGNKDNYYLSTGFVSGMLDLVKSFDYPIGLSESELAKLKGKYIDLGKAGDAFTAGELDKKTNPLKEKLFANDKDAKLGRETKKLIESFDKKTFTKNKDIVTHTFTKKEIVALMEKVDEVSSEDKDYKNSDEEKELKETIKTVKNDLDKLDLKISINQKTQATDMKVSLAAKDDNDANMELAMTISVTPEKNKRPIKMPSKTEIISQDELDAIFATLMKTETPFDDSDLSDEGIDYGDLKDDPAIQQVLDDQLNEIIQQIEANPSMITEESAQEVRNGVKGIFNEEQMKKLNDALDKALQAGTI